MKIYKCFDFSDFPPEIRDLVRDRLSHNGSYFNYYPGDGHFKSPSEVKVPENAMEWEPKLNDYVYEKGDDPFGDYLMSEGAELCEQVIVLVNW